MIPDSITPDTQVTFLLCGRFGQNESSKTPLNAAEYFSLCQWLRNESKTLPDLFDSEVVDRYSKISRFDAKRLPELLNRGGALALAVEDWNNKGIWILSPTDKHYPRRLTERLPNKAPPLLFGAGNPQLLSKGGLAVVGSRDISERAKLATHKIGRLCVQNRIPLISGGARGVDSEAMQTVLEEGGQVIGFIADSLLKMSLNGKYRQALRDQRLVLVTSNDPKTPFSVGNAMARNKFVYCLSDWTLVIASSYNEGGTWAGATENLKNKWVPLFVREDVDVPEGNYRLIERGATAIRSDSFTDPDVFLTILKNSQAMVGKPCIVCDLTSTYSTSEETPVPHEIAAGPVEIPSSTQKISQEINIGQKPNDLFPIVWPCIEKQLATPKTEKELAECFNVEVKQMRAWLSSAVEKGDVQKLVKPVRYVLPKKPKVSLDTWIEN
ncbi:DNA-processing protein DprA [Methanoregula formicica]|uniref:Putative Rossmann fold nucleotide-binding protein involved in DNA uptake n=1 Tax=Methanoregula formicica (strain DSM 22288 / NBRC 105244 / SMSP) TaxID=593750 RepID=L0HET9_METFS|nr:DNA-processing protein DprA [Methanoregula formicica]AGB02291.1 putative Rossmann fold nucleotide-binding protein involved in DNA uptake [Methanoregula formicica SMSP]